MVYTFLTNSNQINHILYHLYNTFTIAVLPMLSCHALNGPQARNILCIFKFDYFLVVHYLKIPYTNMSFIETLFKVAFCTQNNIYMVYATTVIIHQHPFFLQLQKNAELQAERMEKVEQQSETTNIRVDELEQTVNGNTLQIHSNLYYRTILGKYQQLFLIQKG